MFNQLPGSRRAMVHQMHQQLERWYGRLATRTIRKTRSPIWAPYLPKGIFVPDLPVPKRSKQSLRDVSTNDGLHMHGIMVANRWARIPETLDVYFEENLGTYVTSKLRHIDVQRITHRARYVTEYALKSLKRSTFSEDDILVLPRSLSELPDRNPSSVHNRPSNNDTYRGFQLGELESSVLPTTRTPEWGVSQSSVPATRERYIHREVLAPIAQRRHSSSDFGPW